MSKLIPFQSATKKRSDNDFFIISNGKGSIIYLNRTSEVFYEMSDGKRNINDIYLSMLELYDVGEEELKMDIVALIRDMQWNEILSLKEDI